jgi:hypothetical protein
MGLYLLYLPWLTVCHGWWVGDQKLQFECSRAVELGENFPRVSAVIYDAGDETVLKPVDRGLTSPTLLT